MLHLLWVPRPDDRRESVKHNPADADDALSPGCPIIRSKCCTCCGFQGQTIGERVLNTIQLMLMMLSPRALYIRPSIRSKCCTCCGFPRPDDRRESFKHKPADADDALSPGSLHPSKHSVEVLCLLWVPRPEDRRETFKHKPADADDAPHRSSLNPFHHSVEVLRLLWVLMLSPRAL